MIKVGYARISTREQNLNMQVIALEEAGCERIYEEITSGAKSDRPILNNLLNQLRDGDVLVVWKLDRLGRSLKHLVELVQMLMQQNIGLCSLNDPIDTTTSQGRLIFNIFASLAEFERDLIRECTRAGLNAARMRGRLGGRPRGLSGAGEATACAVESLYREGKLPVNQIAKKLNISKSTLYKYLRYRNVNISSYQKKSLGKTTFSCIITQTSCPEPTESVGSKELACLRYQSLTCEAAPCAPFCIITFAESGFLPPIALLFLVIISPTPSTIDFINAIFATLPCLECTSALTAKLLSLSSATNPLTFFSKNFPLFETQESLVA